MLRKLAKDAPHLPYYTRDGIKVPSCTAISGLAESSEGLIIWANKQGLAGKSHKDERDAAAYSGTIAHAKSIEEYLIGDELDLSEFSEEAIGLAQKAFEKFKEWWDEKGMTFIFGEQMLVSHDHLFGGKPDILARNPEGKRCLIDLKATKKIHASHTIQVVGGYRILLNENFPDEKIDEICILRLPKDDSRTEPLWIDPENFWYYERAFLANLAAQKARNELEAVLPKSLKKWKPRKCAS